MDLKTCANCGKELNKSQKKYCCHQCQTEYLYNSYITRWKNGLESGNTQDAIRLYIRRYLFQKYDNKCSQCGWNKVNPFTRKIPLQVHHKDGNCLNSQEDNLVLLCPNCHSLTENFMALNRASQLRHEIRRKHYLPTPKPLQPPKTCPICGNPMSQDAEMCRECYDKSRYKNWPSAEELTNTLNNLKTYTAVGEFYGVTGTTVRKWCKRYNIEK